jgi:hypothetical protein
MPAGTDPARPWYLDLLKALDGGERRAAYLRTRLQWPAAQRVTLRIGSDDGIKVWVNGQLVHANNATRSFAPDQDSATVTLKVPVHKFLCSWRDLACNLRIGKAWLTKTL